MHTMNLYRVDAIILTILDYTNLQLLKKDGCMQMQ